MYQTNITSSTLLARKVKVRTLQYKFTVFFFALVLFAFWPQITERYNIYKFTVQSYKDTLVQHETVKVQRANALRDAQLLGSISSDAQRSSLIQCFNTDCPNLPEEIKNEPIRSTVKTYLQLQKETPDTKFTLDQKKLLTYLNEFLVRTSADAQTLNWQIDSVSFAGSTPFEKWSIIIPMSVWVTFQNKDWLLAFLRNIEKYISPTFPMYAVVNSVQYDIINSNAVQNVTIDLNIYMLD